MKAKGLVVASVAALAGWFGYRFWRRQPAEAEDLPPEDEEPIVGTQFRNLTAVFSHSAFTPADNVSVIVSWEYRGDGGYFDDGVLIDANPTRTVRSRNRHYASSSQWVSVVKTFFTTSISTQLPPGSTMDAMAFIVKPEIIASFDNAGQMELTTWYYDVLKVAD